MSKARVKKVVEYGEAGDRREHEIPMTSNFSARAKRPDKPDVGRVMGPDHVPYFLMEDGTIDETKW
jgi:hypothetical protein